MLVTTKIVSAARAKEFQDIAKRGPAARQGGICFSGVGDVVMLYKRKQGSQHFFWGEDVIGHASRNRTPSHPVKLSGLRRLYQAHSAFGPYGPETFRSVASGSGKHDRNRLLTLIQSKGAEEHIDRMTMRSRRFGDVKPSLANDQIGIRSDDVDVIASESHPVGYLEDRHSRMCAQNVGKFALLGIEMQHHNEGAAIVGRRSVKELAKRFDAASRRTDPDKGHLQNFGRGYMRDFGCACTAGALWTRLVIGLFADGSLSIPNCRSESRWLTPT